MEVSLPEHVALTMRGRIAEIEFRNPPVNILTMKVLDEITAAVEEAGASPARALLLRGAGRHFSAGADVGEHLPGVVEKMLPGLTRSVMALRKLDIPSLAHLHGAAMGGALELAIACDFVIAAEDARLSFPEITLGVFPPVAAALLPLSMNPSRALDLILSGEQIPPHQAASVGLIHRVGTADDAVKFLERFVRHPRPSIVAARRAARAGEMERLLRAEQIYLTELMSHPEPVEGIRAFVEKRRPSWETAP